MMSHLLYRRQFLLARQSVPALSNWQKTTIGPYYLYAHIDLELTVVNDSSKILVLLGHIFDPENQTSNNKQILQRLLSNVTDFKSLIQLLKFHVGRFALIYKDDSSFNVIQDALALREIYYCTKSNLVICGSQPNLLVDYSIPRIKESTDPDIIDFIQNHSPHIRNGRLWPGDSTAYQNVKHLLPNHYLDLIKLESFRYWPSTLLKRIALDEAVKKCSTFLQNALKAMANRHPLMMAVTAGFDSRALLAASKEISQSIYYFINKTDRLNDQSPDIVIPQTMFGRIGLPFHIHCYSKDVPDEFKVTFFKNTFFARDTLLPAIYNVYFKNHSEKVNILGVGEIGRTKFYNEPKSLSPYYLAFMLHHRKSPFVVKECEAWLNVSKNIAHEYGLNIMTLFWWEILIGNWGAVGNSESDIAMEEFDPFGSHFIYETFLQVDEKYRTYKNNILFKELIQYMWPELMNVPVNPTVTLKGKIEKILYSFGIEYKMRRIHALLSELFYHAYWKKRANKKYEKDDSSEILVQTSINP